MEPLNKELLELIYDSASIRRWNDQVNPMDFTELDKQAHKMIIAYVLAKTEEDIAANSIDWLKLIEGAFFEMLHRIILTDIKPPVFHKMMQEKGKELNKWVFKELKSKTSTIQGDFHERLQRYFTEESYSSKEKRILKAAHYLATQWEFNILYKMCPFIRGIDNIRQEIEDQIEDHFDLSGVQKISLGRKTASFIDLCGQLRFQKRWSQSPRIPATSVLGHMHIVALLTYISLCQNNASDARKRHGFFAALFHDLPEVLTRDITSPIKGAVEGLDSIIKDYETRQMEEKLLPLLPKSWHWELSYYTENEFNNRVVLEGEVKTDIEFEEFAAKYSAEKFIPVDGELIRCCDHLAALIEASSSIKHGITSKYLQEGLQNLQSSYANRKLGKVDFGKTFAAFTDELIMR